MKKILIFLLSFFLILKFNNAQISQSSKIWNYPFIAPDTAIDDYFGRKVIDPYRNLENLENEYIKTWMMNQNNFYDSIIQNITFRDSIKKELKTLSKMGKKWTGYSRIAGNRIFYTTGNLSDYNIKLVYIDSLYAEPIELFNTREFNKKDSCYYGFNYYEPSFDGNFIAFGISPNGNENATIYIVDVEKRQLLSEKIERCFAGNIQWLPNSKGFFYIQQRELFTKEEKQNPYADPVVKYHSLHTNTKLDKNIFSRKINNEFDLSENDWFILNINPSSEYVLMNVLRDSYFIVYYTKLNNLINLCADKIKWNQLYSLEDKMCNNGVIGNSYFGLSYKQNPNGQLISLVLPDLNQKIVWEAADFVMEDMVINQKCIYITTLEGAINKLFKVNPKNYHLDTIKLPFMGGISTRPSFSISPFYQSSDNLIFSITGYDKPYSDYICHNNNDVVNTNITPEVNYITMEVITEEIEIPSFDGILVPLSIVYKKGIKFDGSNPCNIEAYGAYGNVKKPEFSRNRLIWLKNGGIYAYAHVRGGGEKGDNWGKSGMRENKPNSWKDLIACTEYLIKLKYTSPKHLAIMGKSAGAVTVGRALTERPDLYKAAIIYVGIFNPLRMENTFNKSTKSEFGSSKDSLGFQYLYNMDPYLHLRDGQNYPSVLFTASLNDARVTPWQPAKGVAKMQSISKGDNIILFRIGNYGHYSYPSDADVYSFLFWQLGHPDFKLKTNDNMFKSVNE